MEGLGGVEVKEGCGGEDMNIGGYMGMGAMWYLMANEQGRGTYLLTGRLNKLVRSLQVSWSAFRRILRKIS